MMGAFLVLEIISIVVLLVNFWCVNDKNEDFGIGISCTALVIVFTLCFICNAFVTEGGYKSISPLLGHIDKDKTKVSEANGEITDLWITVDGKEYHFELKQE